MRRRGIVDTKFSINVFLESTWIGFPTELLLYLSL